MTNDTSWAISDIYRTYIGPSLNPDPNPQPQYNPNPNPNPTWQLEKHCVIDKFEKSKGDRVVHDVGQHEGLDEPNRVGLGVGGGLARGGGGGGL